VDVTLKKKKNGTFLKLTHRKLGKNSKWNAIGKEYGKEWTKALDNLTSVLENGPDLRITTRPMLGISTDEFNAGIAEKLGVPIAHGLRLSGVIEGLGAQKAGLIANDIIVGLGGDEITGAASFSTFIKNKKAGDIVEVTFYRCAEKKTAKMTLSGRPIPPILLSGQELAKQVEPVYHRYESEIESLLKSASEAECAKKPAPTEWSVNEVLAHLIHSEHGSQNYMTEIMGGHESTSDDWGGNIQAYIDGIVATFKTKSELFKELKKYDAVTLSMYEHIPADFVTHKGKFWKLAFYANQNSYHLQSHLEQMRSAIQSAKQT
jgi:membrane-associated protease RseP (regulator of RpoE activity)